MKTLRYILQYLSTRLLKISPRYIWASRKVDRLVKAGKLPDREAFIAMMKSNAEAQQACETASNIKNK